MKVISLVEYHVRIGCAEEFIAAFDAPGGISQGVNYQRLIQVTDTRFIGISEMDDIEIAVNKEGPGIDWLDRHEHLLEKYENGSRTDSCSGLVVHSYDKENLSKEVTKFE